VAARGETVTDARDRVYREIAGLKARFPAGTPLAYRSDIGRL
jgi:hypothetical protein